MGENTSLAVLVKNADFKKNVLYKETCTAHVKTFFLTGKYVAESVKCALETCKIDESRAAFSSLDETMCNLTPFYDPFCFCYCCNRTFHIKCQNLDLSKFIDITSPFICNECFGKPLNEHAVAYYDSQSWKSGVATRRQQFFSPEALSNHPELMQDQTLEKPFDDDDIKSFIPVEELVDDSFNNDSLVAIERQRLETVKVALAYKKHVKTSNESHSEKDEIIRQLQEQLEQERANKQPPPQPQNQTKKRVSFQPPGSAFESTRAGTSRQFRVTTAEEILANITRQTEYNRSGHTSSSHTTNIPPLSFGNLEDSLPSPNDNSLSNTERMLLCSTRAQLQSSQAQSRVSMAMQLEVIRKNLPRITKFKGSARGWLKFKQEVHRYKDLGQYPDEVMKMVVLGALEGDAEKRVKDLVDVSTFGQMMEILETSFGYAPSIIKACEDDILKFKIKGELMRNDAVHINTLIQTYLNACSVAGVATLNTNMLATHIINQFNPMHKFLFKQHHQLKRPLDVTLMPELEVLFSFLEQISRDLEVRPEEKPIQEKSSSRSAAQVNSIATSPASTQNSGKSGESANQQADDYLFTILDSNQAKFLGYDLELVESVEKRCLFCDSTDHYSLECNTFRSMTDTQRREIVMQKNLCKLCLLTDAHRAADCTLKLCCGFKCSDNTRCVGKHHVILHEPQLMKPTVNKSNEYRGPRRRANTNFNSRRGSFLANNGNQSEAKQNATNATTETTHTASTSATTPTSTPTPVAVGALSVTQSQPVERKYETFARQYQTISYSSFRTIKVFKHIVYGPSKGAIIYSVGDSAAEITVIREDLRRQLNIEGTKTSIDLQWKDKIMHQVNATKIDLEIKSLDTDEIIILKEVYAIDEANFSLPSRSLNVEELKRRFPYLKDAKFDSYVDEQPALLIGTTHAACFEAVEPLLHGGEGNPVAVKTRLGWSIFGGAPESYEENSYAIQATGKTQSQNNSSFNQNLNVSQYESHLTPVEKGYPNPEILHFLPALPRKHSQKEVLHKYSHTKSNCVEEKTLCIPIVNKRKTKELKRSIEGRKKTSPELNNVIQEAPVGEICMPLIIKSVEKQNRSPCTTSLPTKHSENSTVLPIRDKKFCEPTYQTDPTDQLLFKALLPKEVDEQKRDAQPPDCDQDDQISSQTVNEAEVDMLKRQSSPQTITQSMEAIPVQADQVRNEDKAVLEEKEAHIPSS